MGAYIESVLAIISNLTIITSSGHVYAPDSGFLYKIKNELINANTIFRTDVLLRRTAGYFKKIVLNVTKHRPCFLL